MVNLTRMPWLYGSHAGGVCGVRCRRLACNRQPADLLPCALPRVACHVSPPLPLLSYRLTPPPPPALFRSPRHPSPATSPPWTPPPAPTPPCSTSTRTRCSWRRQVRPQRGQRPFIPCAAAVTHAGNFGRQRPLAATWPTHESLLSSHNRLLNCPAPACTMPRTHARRQRVDQP